MQLHGYNFLLRFYQNIYGDHFPQNYFQNIYGDHFPILVWGSFSYGDHFLHHHNHTHTGASCSDTPAPTLVLVAELELELLKILLYNFLTNKGKKLQYWEEKNLQKPLRFLIRWKIIWCLACILVCGAEIAVQFNWLNQNSLKLCHLNEIRTN